MQDQSDLKMSEEKTEITETTQDVPTPVPVTQSTGKEGGRGDFLKQYKDKHPRVRRDIFEDYVQKNSFELDLPNTQNKMIISVHQRKNDETDHLLKWQIGQSSMFIDAKTAFVVSEAMRHLTVDIVPDELKPIADIKQAEIS